MKVGAIIQARLGSERLPGKVLMPIVNKPLLWHVINRLKIINNLDCIIVATSTNSEDDLIEKNVLDWGFNCFRGSSENVLERFYQASKKYELDVIVRVTSDNPLTEPLFIAAMIEQYKSQPCDYIKMGNCPLGTPSELFSFNVLETCFNKAEKSYQKEHVTPYIYENPKDFNIVILETEKIYQDTELRLTVDTPQDMILMRNVYKNLYKEGSIVDLIEVIDFLDKNPKIRTVNTNVYQKPYNQ